MGLIEKTIMRELRLNVLPIFYPKASYSLITKLPSLFFLNEEELLQIKTICNQWVKREHKNIEMKFQWQWYFQTIFWFTCLIFFPMQHRETLVQMWQKFYGFPIKTGTSFKNVVKMLWHVYLLFENTMLHCNQIVLWNLYRGTKLRVTFVILIWYLLC